MSRAAIAILSTENLIHNAAVIRGLSSGAKITAMIKANAYGHGLRAVALRLEKHVDSLGVSCIEEALALRKVGVKTPITLVEGVFEPDELLIASCQNFDVVFHEERQLKWLEQVILPVPLKVWLKIDTGMSRLGFLPKEAEKAYESLKMNQNVVQPVNFLSHFACADQAENILNQHQKIVFDTFVKGLPGLKSLANSAGIFQFPEAHYDMVRPGIALYGVSPFSHMQGVDLGLKPVMTLQTRLISVRYLKKGSSIGYGGRFVCPEKMPIGVIAMGYGDGYPRTAQDGTPILVNNVRCQVVGCVSMDMATIDLRACPTAKVGDPVVLWGDALPIEEVAKFTSHIPYDLLCNIQSRVKFHWTINV
jgi:alanine racemase